MCCHMKKIIMIISQDKYLIYSDHSKSHVQPWILATICRIESYVNYIHQENKTQDPCCCTVLRVV